MNSILCFIDSDIVEAMGNATKINEKTSQMTALSTIPNSPIYTIFPTRSLCSFVVPIKYTIHSTPGKAIVRKTLVPKDITPIKYKYQFIATSAIMTPIVIHNQYVLKLRPKTCSRFFYILSFIF